MKIMIIDDSRAMRSIVSRTLRQAGYANNTLEEATNGAEALTMILASPPDLVLSDWNMPEMSGIELLRELKKAESPVKFIFVTSEGTHDMRQQAEESGALALISKPFTADTFKSVLEPYLG